MKESYLLDMTFNNIVFKGRNQAYGAYALRKTYSRHIMQAALIATALFSGALVWSLLSSTTSVVEPKKVEDKSVTILYPLDIPPPPPAKEKAAPVPATQQPTKRATVKNVAPKVVEDKRVVKEEELPTQQELSKADGATQTMDGDPSATELPITDIPGNGTSEVTPPSSTEIYDFVAEMPAFEGGEKALMKYLSRNLRYPTEAIQAGVEGIVVVSFVVNSSGQVSEATVVKSLGYGTDEEALRVIRNMPYWTPGRQNGKPVAVRFTMPIRFSMKR